MYLISLLFKTLLYISLLTKGGRNCGRLGFKEPCQFTLAAPRRAERERSSTHLQAIRVSRSHSPASYAASSNRLNTTFDLLDMELLHYYVVHTASTLSDSSTYHVHQDSIPNLAFANTYLLHGVIAIAALHKASTVRADRNKYIQKAAESLNSGLPRLHSLIANLENESPHAVTMYAGFVGLYAIGLPAAQFRDGNVENALQVLFDAFELIRGTATIITQTWLQILDGPIAPLMKNISFKNLEEDRFSSDRGTLDKDHYRAHLLQKLAELNELIGEDMDQAHYRPPVFLLKRLAECFVSDSKTCHPNTPFLEAPALLMSWPARLTAEFIRFLREDRPPAILILAYYSLFLRKESWFHGDWRKWILSSLTNLNLSEPWSSHLRWINMQVARAPAEI